LVNAVGYTLPNWLPAMNVAKLVLTTLGSIPVIILLAVPPDGTSEETSWVSPLGIVNPQATPGDGRIPVAAVRHYKAELRTYYNLTVQSVHTYCVLAGTAPVLVHNTGPCGLTEEALDQAWQTWNTPANLEHVIDPAKHGFGDLVTRTGGSRTGPSRDHGQPS
jgi:hypothetical protein